MAKTQKYPQTLLVEGKNDLHVVKALCIHYNVTENFDISDCDGINNLLRVLKVTLTNQSLYITIGIILDADNSIASRLDQIRNIVKQLGYTVPTSLPNTGLICTSSDSMYPQLGLWLMPDNVNLGMVEDFAISLAPQNDPLMAETEVSLQRIEVAGIQKCIPKHRSKAKIHTYLAWQDESGAPIGQSITKQVLNPNYPIAQGFVQNWLVPLFQ